MGVLQHPHPSGRRRALKKQGFAPGPFGPIANVRVDRTRLIDRHGKQKQVINVEVGFLDGEALPSTGG